MPGIERGLNAQHTILNYLKTRRTSCRHTFPIQNACGIVMLSKLRRSEEHTSELQSQSNLVCRLLLEKKIYIFFIGIGHYVEAGTQHLHFHIIYLHKEGLFCIFSYFKVSLSLYFHLALCSIESSRIFK